METLLIEFIDTLDLSLKKLQAEAGDSLEISKLTLSQLQYIQAIGTLGTPTLTEIADKLNITKASVTVGINKLSQMGYVLKTQSREDKRVFHVCLTEISGQFIQTKQLALKEYVEFIISTLTEEEARQFETTLTKLVELFKKE